MNSKWSRGLARVLALTLPLAAIFVGAAYFPVANKLNPEITAHNWYFPHVPEMMDKNVYFVIHLDPHDPLFGTRSRYTFCEYDPPFSEGQMLTTVIYIEREGCKQLVHFNFELTGKFVRNYPEGNPYDGYGR